MKAFNSGVIMTDLIDQLSPRELEVLKMISAGNSRETISSLLNISKLTYDDHRKNIRIKLGIKNSADWATIMYHVRQKEKIEEEK